MWELTSEQRDDAGLPTLLSPEERVPFDAEERVPFESSNAREARQISRLSLADCMRGAPLLDTLDRSAAADSRLVVMVPCRGEPGRRGGGEKGTGGGEAARSGEEADPWSSEPSSSSAPPPPPFGCSGAPADKPPFPG